MLTIYQASVYSYFCFPRVQIISFSRLNKIQIWDIPKCLNCNLLVLAKYIFCHFNIHVWILFETNWSIRLQRYISVKKIAFLSLLKSVHFKMTVAWSSIYFKIVVLFNFVLMLAVVVLKSTTIWNKWGSRNCLLKMNGLYINVLLYALYFEQYSIEKNSTNAT